MSKKINIDEIEDYYILAENLVNKYGQTLINKGTQLNKAKHNQILTIWGIKEISVYENISDEIENSSNHNDKSEIEKELLSYLNWNIKDANDKFLFDIAVAVKVGEFDFE